MTNILVLGDIIIDKYVYGAVDRLAPDFLGFVFDEIESETFLGGAGLVAQTAANLLPSDVGITLVGSMPKQFEALLSPRIALRSLSTEGMIKTRYIATGQGRPDKPWSSQKIMRVDNLKTFSTSCTKEIKGDYDYILVIDYDKGTIQKDTKFPSYSKVLLDTKHNSISKYSKCDILKVNRHEADRLDRDLLKVPISIITHGKKPIELRKNGDVSLHVMSYDIPLHNSVVYDPCGAGDTFLIGLLYGLLHNKNIEECAKYGSIAGAIKVFSYGTKPIEKEKFEEEIKNARRTGYLVE